MKVKTFWSILLRIIGIVLALKGVNVVVHSITTVLIISWNSTEGVIWSSLSIWNLLTIILTVVVYLFVLWLFIFKTSWLIDKLRLEKGFEEEKIELNTQLSNILSITLIVIGGIVLIESLPQLCKQVFSFFQERSMFRESPTTGWIILYLLKTILGYLLMTNSKQITDFINKRSRSNVESDNE